MTYTQAVFLGHWIPIVVIFWLWCWYQSWKKKKARKRANVNGPKKNLASLVYHKKEIGG